MTKEEKKLRQQYETPMELFELLDREFKFDIDVAASDRNHKCPNYYTEEDDSLDDDIHWFTSIVGSSVPSRSAFCNPGFSDLGPWMEKAASQVNTPSSHSKVAVVVGLVSPSTEWWRFCVDHASEIRMLSPRVQFKFPDALLTEIKKQGKKPSSNDRENCVVIFRQKPLIFPPKAHIWNWRWLPIQERKKK
jgi:phage N-6-adenine-methyltransferase